MLIKNCLSFSQRARRARLVASKLSNGTVRRERRARTARAYAIECEKLAALQRMGALVSRLDNK